jgi:hypothetical protein
MKQKTYRKLVTLATTAAIALGGLSIAPSAAAFEQIEPSNVWTGTQNCPFQSG